MHIGIFIEKSEKYTDISVLTKHKSSVKSVDFLGQVQGKILGVKKDKIKK